MLGLMALPAAGSLIVFIIVFLLFRLVSLGSIIAGISLPIMVYTLSDHPLQLIIISVMVSVMVIITHRKNIERLVRGEESKLVLRSEKKIS